MRKIYFDNAATTKPAKEVLELLIKLAEDTYANPSSMHDMGLDVELEIKEASKILATVLKCDHEEIVYTSGGTESNNLAIFGTSGASNKKHIVTTKAEHPSVLECFKKLETQGYKTTYLSLTDDGIIDLKELSDCITENTALVSILHANNETGVMQDIENIGNIIKEKNEKTLYHVDAVQSFCKHDINVKKSKIDLLSMSSHKIHGLKGMGALYVNKNKRITPMLYGGGQQRKIRPGTEDSFGIISFAKAIELMFNDMDNNLKKVDVLKKFIIKNIKNVIINSSINSSPYVLNLSIPGIKAEVLLHALGSENIFVSAGSACSSKIKNHSVLRSYGKSNEIIDSSIRLSFSHYNTIQEAESFIGTIEKLAKLLIRIT